MATRRGNQEGSLTHRKDGRWMARVSQGGNVSRFTERLKKMPGRSSALSRGNKTRDFL
jgi:hypothetical protein